MYDPETRFHSIDCRYCQQTFRTRFGRQRYCSDLCYSQAHPHKPHRYPFWTHREDRLLRQLASTLPVKEIAVRLGRTHAAVKSRAHQLKINLHMYGERHPNAKHSDALVEQARTLHEEGVSRKAIAIRLGIPLKSIEGYVYYQQRLGPPIERYF